LGLREAGRYATADKPASKPNFAATDGTPNGAQDPQDDSDDDQDSADCVQDGDPGEIADNEKNDAEDDHDLSDLQVAAAAAAAAAVRIPIAPLFNQCRAANRRVNRPDRRHRHPSRTADPVWHGIHDRANWLVSVQV
jgi:hypothetical protein